VRWRVEPMGELRAFAVACAGNCRWRSLGAGVRSQTMAESLLAPWMAWLLLEDARVQLIDLRGRDEVDLPRIPGAHVIPLDELPSELVALDRERPVVFVSGTGRKAAAAMEVLRSAGITAGAVDGGIRAWLEAGLPIENDTARAWPSRA